MSILTFYHYFRFSRPIWGLRFNSSTLTAFLYNPWDYPEPFYCHCKDWPNARFARQYKTMLLIAIVVKL